MVNVRIVGTSCQMRMPRMMLMGRDVYSKGAATDACARLYARAIKYIKPAQIYASATMIARSKVVGMVQYRSRKAMLACALGGLPTRAASGDSVSDATR
jgi:hypothetical protein